MLNFKTKFPHPRLHRRVSRADFANNNTWVPGDGPEAGSGLVALKFLHKCTLSSAFCWVIVLYDITIIFSVTIIIALCSRWTVFPAFPTALKAFAEEIIKTNLVMSAHKNCQCSLHFIFSESYQETLVFKRTPLFIQTVLFFYVKELYMI